MNNYWIALLTMVSILILSQSSPLQNIYFDNECIKSTLYKSDSVLNLQKAIFASGKIVESLLLFAETSSQNLSSKEPFLSSFGSHDACYKIPNYEYCTVEVLHQNLWYYGICVPKECENSIYQDIQLFAQKYNISASSFLTFHCGDTSYSWSVGAMVMIILCSIIFILCMLASIFQYYHLENPWIECFSLSKNAQSLLAKPRSNVLDCLDGIRSLSIFWVVFGHTFIFETEDLAFSNYIDLLGINHQGWLASLPAQALTGAYFAVDTFFFISGFLACYIMLKKFYKMLEQKQYVRYLKSIPFIYLNRFLRLTPTYFFVLLMYLKIVPLLSSGPFWNILDNDQSFCNQYWWTNLLYINNLYPTENHGGCYAVAWYLANDVQFFIFVPWIVWSTSLSPSCTIGILLVIMLTSMMSSFFIALHQHWSISIYNFNAFMEYFQSYYIVPWGRCPPYIFGIILAILWFFYKEDLKKVVLSRMQSLLLFCIALFLFGITIIGGRGAYSNLPSDWSNLTMSFYIALSKPAWSVGVFILVGLLFMEQLLWVDLILNNHLMAVLGRISFCIYLVHPSIINWYYYSAETPPHFNGLWYTINYLGLLSLSIIVSILVHLFVELPVGNLTKLMLNEKPKKKPQDSTRTPLLEP
jgi:peptidoglycan/LPS O-acetylase OafA/YrhL